MADPVQVTSEIDVTSVEHALLTRRSVRAFLPKDVPGDLVKRILELAKRSPSGGNVQPWKVHVVRGSTKSALEADLTRIAQDVASQDPEYNYYPLKWREPYSSRRREIGEALYGALGIGRRDVRARRHQHLKNFSFFGAPVGIFFCTDRQLSCGSWIDMGMFMQSIMLSARSLGLDTCPQAAFTSYHQVVRNHLNLPEEEILLCGMALGYEDKSASANQVRSTRVPLEQFATFHGGGD